MLFCPPDRSVTINIALYPTFEICCDESIYDYCRSDYCPLARSALSVSTHIPNVSYPCVWRRCVVCCRYGLTLSAPVRCGAIGGGGGIRGQMHPITTTGGSSRRFWGRPTWRSDPSQGIPKTKNSSDLAHYFWGSGPKSLTKIKIYKKENKKVRLQVPGSSWKSMVSPVGP